MHGNYQNRFNNFKNEAPKAVTSSVKEILPVETPIEAGEALATDSITEVPDIPEKKDVFGVVAKCSMLNVRTAPDSHSDIAVTIPAGTELMIGENSTNEFYQVCTTAGIKGFCMKKYIKLKT